MVVERRAQPRQISTESGFAMAEMKDNGIEGGAIGSVGRTEQS